MDWIESLNERRLARLGELQKTTRSQRGLGETDIIDAFLKRSSDREHQGRKSTHLIPTSDSILKPLIGGRV